MQFQPNMRLQVRDDHVHHARKVGFFQFLGGPDRDVVVLEIARQGTAKTLIGVGVNDVIPLQQ